MDEQEKAKRQAFKQELSWLAQATGKAIASTDQEAKVRLLCYYEALGHVPHELLHAAVRLVAAEHTYPTYPTIADIMQRCLKLVQVDFAEVWVQALTAARSMVDPRSCSVKVIPGTGEQVSGAEWNQRVLDGLQNQRLAYAIKAFGWKGLREDSVIRAQFRKMYEEIAGKEQIMKALLPPKSAAALLEGRMLRIEHAKDQEP